MGDKEGFDRWVVAELICMTIPIGYSVYTVSEVYSVDEPISNRLAVVATCIGIIIATGIALLQLRFNRIISKEQSKGSVRQNELAEQQNELAKIQNDLAEQQNKLAKIQNDLTERQNKEQLKTSERQNELAEQQNKLAKQHLLLARHQYFPVIWKEMHDIELVNTKDMSDADWHYAIKVGNVLELLAICYETGMVDRKVIKRAYRDSFVKLFENLQECIDPPEGFKSGKELIKGLPSVEALYKLLDSERLGRDTVSDLFGDET